MVSWVGGCLEKPEKTLYLIYTLITRNKYLLHILNNHIFYEHGRNSF